MDTSTRSDATPVAPPAAPPAAPAPMPTPGLGAELRESLVLLTFALGVTVGLTTAAQAALSALA